MKRSGPVSGILSLGILALGMSGAHGQPAGSIVGWGWQVVVEQAALENVVAVAAGGCHNLGVKSDGTIVAWGWNDRGGCNVPEPNADFVAVAAGWEHSLGVKSDGTVVAWGWNEYGQCDVPEPNADFVAVAAGGSHSLGLKSSPASAVEEPARGDAPGVAWPAILSLAPNPSHPSTEVSFATVGSGPVIMEIHDVGGRRVAALPLGDLGPGAHRVSWDGRDGRGARVLPGIYFVRLRSAEGASQPAKLTLIR